MAGISRPNKASQASKPAKLENGRQKQTQQSKPSKLTSKTRKWQAENGNA